MILMNRLHEHVAIPTAESAGPRRFLSTPQPGGQISDHLRGAMNLVLQLRNSGSGTRPNGSRAARD
jgi:hypothetical protein